MQCCWPEGTSYRQGSLVHAYAVTPSCSGCARAEEIGDGAVGHVCTSLPSYSGLPSVRAVSLAALSIARASCE